MTRLNTEYQNEGGHTAALQVARESTASSWAFTLEPVAVINGTITILEAAIALAVGFGLDWSAEQVGLVMAVVVAVGNLIKTIWARGQVTPVAAPRDNQGRELMAAG
jgi:hypothetical protein